MKTIRKMVTIGIAAALLLTSLPPVAKAFLPGGSLPLFGGEPSGLTQISGRVVCIGCSINDVRAAQPELPQLHQLKHQHGQLIMTLQSVTEQARWENIVGMSQNLWVRAPIDLFRQLNAEENLFKEVVILGMLRNDRTFDMSEVRFPDPSTGE